MHDEPMYNETERKGIKMKEKILIVDDEKEIADYDRVVFKKARIIQYINITQLPGRWTILKNIRQILPYWM